MRARDKANQAEDEDKEGDEKLGKCEHLIYWACWLSQLIVQVFTKDGLARGDTTRRFQEQGIPCINQFINGPDKVPHVYGNGARFTPGKSFHTPPFPQLTRNLHSILLFMRRIGGFEPRSRGKFHFCNVKNRKNLHFDLHNLPLSE